MALTLNRKCGECKACCSALAIKELNKPKGEPCLNLIPSGCSIYPDRPQVCQQFQCAWLDETLHIDWRPDKIGLMVYGMRSAFGFAYGIMELWENARLSPKSQRLIETLAEDHLCFIIRKDGNRTAVGPEAKMGPVREAIRDAQYPGLKVVGNPRKPINIDSIVRGK